MIALALMASALSACGADDQPTAGNSITSTAATSTTAADTTTPTSLEVTTSTTEAPASRTVALASDGLLLVAGDTGSTIPLPFGTPKDDVMIALRQALGDPTDEGAGSSECPNGQDWATVWPDTLLVAFSGGGFLTWSLRPGSALTDMTGIGLGSSVAELTATWNIEIQDSSLGVEFFTTDDGAGLGGVLSDSSGTAVVTNLWAGPACIFR
jgi:hypothetical protein